MKERHLHEVEVLKEQMQREREERAEIEKQKDGTRAELETNQFKMQEECQKAVKINQTNKELYKKNQLLIKEMDRLKGEQSEKSEKNSVLVRKMEQQME